MNRAEQLYGKPWSKREYILVLDAYFQHGDGWVDPASPKITELSTLMGRTPASVVMRMENFASVDPDNASRRRGLIHITPLGKKVFDEYAGDRDSLHGLAAFLGDEAASQYLPLFDSNSVAIPKAFGKYQLGDLIGDGGFGVVYSCTDTKTDGLFAIKIVRADRIHDNEVRQRFSREMRALKAVRHPNVICLHEDNLESEEELPAFIMDLAATNLHDHMMQKAHAMGESVKRPVLGQSEAIAVFSQVLTAVKTLHAASPRIIHRDINPRNVLLMPNGTWVLADFSLAKFLHSAPVTTAFATRSGQAWATEGYAAPEQYRDFRQADERADVYSLGVLLWELFSSAWPPRRSEALMLAPELDAICTKATSWEAEDRYDCVADLEAAFLDASQRCDQTLR